MTSLFDFRRLRFAALFALVFGAVTFTARADEEQPKAAVTPLGSSQKEIGALYGPVLRHNARVRNHQILEGGTVLDGDLYSRNGLVIRVVFQGGVAVLIEYTRIEGVLTQRDADLLLAANTRVSAWDPGKGSTDTNRYYRRSDGKAVAHYTTDQDGSLLIAAENVGGELFGDRVLTDH